MVAFPIHHYDYDIQQQEISPSVDLYDLHQMLLSIELESIKMEYD